MRLHTFDRCLAISAVSVDGVELLPSLHYNNCEQDSTSSLPLHTIEDSAPFVIAGQLPGEAGSETDINAFLRFLRIDGVGTATARAYACDLAICARFLAESSGKSLADASASDISNYRLLRRDGPIAFRLADSSWRRAAIALTRFFEWGASEEVGRVSNPPKVQRGRPRPHRLSTVRMISLEHYVFFRDVGMLGRLPDGSHDTSFQGRYCLRNAAFAELLVTTGLRVSEATNLIVNELPDSDSQFFDKRRSTMITIPASITKGQKAREVPFPRRVAASWIEPYRREERAEIVERWYHAGGSLNALVAEPVSDGRIHIAAHGKKAISISSLLPHERCRLLLPPNPNGRSEPAALWLNEDGTSMAASAWSAVFQRACERCARYGIKLSVTPHTLRHTFAVHWLSQLVKSEVLALQQRAGGNADRTEELYLRVAGDPLRRVQLWLGHTSIITTQKYLTYLDEAIEAIENCTELLDKRLALNFEV